MRRITFSTIGLLLLCSTLAFGAGDQETTDGGSASMASSGMYNEAPMLAELVAAGELPPVEQRLPDDPPDLLSMFAYRLENPRIGRYGGTINAFATGNDPWQDMTEMPERGSRLLEVGEDGSTIVTELIEGVEASADRRTFTFFLRRGMKWSDGVPFTADDFLFMSEGMLVNENVSTWGINDPAHTVSKTDDYTVVYRFEEPYPKFTYSNLNWVGGEWGRYAPKHYLEKWHIEYNSDANEVAKEEGFDSWSEAFNSHYQIAPTGDINKPTFQAWVFTDYTSSVKAFVRNPYFFGVDWAGNQLPYVDRVVSTIVDAEVYQLKILSGEADVAWMSTSFPNFPLYKENESQGGYNVTLLVGERGSEVPYFFNLNHPDPVQRELFQDIRLRQAMSLAINRDEINQSVFFDVAVPRQAAFNPVGAPWYKPEWGEEHPYAKYDPAGANRLLDEMGLTERDSNGFRKRSDGKTALLIIEHPSNQSSASVHELVKEYWEDVGMQVLIKPADYNLTFERMEAGETEILSEKEGFSALPDLRNAPPETVRWASNWDVWLNANWDVRDGRSTLADFGGSLPGEEPPEDVKKMFDAQIRRFAAEPGSDEFVQAAVEVFDWYAENLVIVGTVGVVPHPYITSAKLGNTVNGNFTTDGITGLVKYLFYE